MRLRARSQFLLIFIPIIADFIVIIFRPYSLLPSNISVSAFKKCKQKIVAIETKKVIPVPYPVPMLMKPTKKPRPQTIVVAVPQPVYKKKKKSPCMYKHQYAPKMGIKCPMQQQLPTLPSIPLIPTTVTNSITDEVSDSSKSS